VAANARLGAWVNWMGLYYSLLCLPFEMSHKQLAPSAMQGGDAEPRLHGAHGRPQVRTRADGGAGWGTSACALESRGAASHNSASLACARTPQGAALAGGLAGWRRGMHFCQSATVVPNLLRLLADPGRTPS
jgi:hypothetical protein